MQSSAKKALIFGTANQRSLAWAIAQQLSKESYELAITYQNEKLERRVRPLAESVNASIIEKCDVTNPNDLDKLFSKITNTWGVLDVLVHSIAFAETKNLEGRFIDTDKEGFSKALEVSTFSLIELAKRSEPLLEKNGGGTILTMTYVGSQKVIPNYNVMGVAKAALEASVRYLAYDLGGKKIRVNAISAGPIKTLAAAGIKNFRQMLSESESCSLLKENITPEDIGSMASFLCSSGARHITGTVLYVDSGLHVNGT